MPGTSRKVTMAAIAPTSVGADPVTEPAATPSPQQGYTIEVRSLTKHYGTAVAVDGLDFDVLPGRVTGFLGPNGAGKSTTLRMVMGLDRPTAGSATVGGRPYGQIKRPLFTVGALLDASAVDPGRSAQNHLLCLARSNGIGSARVDEVLQAVGLTSVAHKRVGGFSLGMHQRLGIAAALLGDPPVLICDEPINGLDPDGIVWIRNLLRSLAGEGRTVFVSSHLMSEMAQTADHLIVIGRGRLLADSSVEEFVKDHSRSYVRVRSPMGDRLAALLAAKGIAAATEKDGSMSVTGADAATIGQLAGENGIILYELSPRQASLEDAFMALTHDSAQFRPSTSQGRLSGSEAA
jgi:ABC-2 type transport system ATP-binding protein